MPIPELYDLELTTCSLGDSGSNAWISIQIFATERNCESLKFNKVSLATNRVYHYNIDCVGEADIGAIYAVRLKTGSGDQLCLKAVKVLSTHDRKLAFFTKKFASPLWMLNNDKWTVDYYQSKDNLDPF